MGRSPGQEKGTGLGKVFTDREGDTAEPKVCVGLRLSDHEWKQGAWARERLVHFLDILSLPC